MIPPVIPVVPGLAAVVAAIAVAVIGLNDARGETQGQQQQCKGNWLHIVLIQKEEGSLRLSVPA
jgi:hypothetical protein